MIFSELSWVSEIVRIGAGENGERKRLERQKSGAEMEIEQPSERKAQKGHRENGGGVTEAECMCRVGLCVYFYGRDEVSKSREIDLPGWKRKKKMFPIEECLPLVGC